MRWISGTILAIGLASCTSVEPVAVLDPVETAPPPVSAEAALAAYYETIPATALPQAPAGPELPAASTPINRILIGSCNDEERESPALARIAREPGDLFMMIGDNVYGDRDGRLYANNDPDLMEVRRSFEDFAASPEFIAARAAHPMMVAWDDHDFGANDAGREFPFRTFAERVHERFWGLDDTEVGDRPGTYYSRSFGPEGQRVQVIMLDTRFFRSGLKGTDEWGAKGKERYLPADGGMEQDMLGAAQWAWLEEQLRAPADLRLVVSSIQVLPTTHGFEAWATMPAERARLFEVIKAAEARGVVFISGDRHTGFLYRDTDVLDYPAYELTTSSLNLSFNDTSDEVDARQIGAGYARENFGDVRVDWGRGVVILSLYDLAGDAVRSVTLPPDEIGG